MDNVGPHSTRPGDVVHCDITELGKLIEDGTDSSLTLGAELIES